MNKIISLATSVVLSSILLSGCGSSSTADKENINQLHNLSTPTPNSITKESRRVITHYNNNENSLNLDQNSPRGFDTIRNINQDRDNLVIEYGDPYQMEDYAHSQIYLNVDNDDNSGYYGADYLIEDGNLYQSNATNHWSWSFVSRVTMQRIENHTIRVVIDLNDLDISNSQIYVKPVLIDNNWQTIWFQGSVVNLVDINIPSNNSDSSILLDQNNISMNMTALDGVVNFTLNSTSNPQKVHPVIMIDSDRDHNSGLRRFGLGSDYLVESGRLYRYNGNGTNWSWQFLKRVDNQLDIDDLGASNSMEFRAMFYDREWQNFDMTDIHTINLRSGNSINIEEVLRDKITQESNGERELVNIAITDMPRAIVNIYQHGRYSGEYYLEMYDISDSSNPALISRITLRELLSNLEGSERFEYGDALIMDSLNISNISVVDARDIEVRVNQGEEPLAIVIYDFLSQEVVHTQDLRN